MNRAIYQMYPAGTTYGSKSYLITNSSATVYTVPAGYTALLGVVQVNEYAGATPKVEVRLLKPAVSDTAACNIVERVMGAKEAYQQTYEPIGLVLEEGDSIKAIASANSQAKLVLSYMLIENA